MTPEERARVIDADPEKAIGLLRAMVRVRRLEDACVEQYSAARIRGFLHVYIGEEAVAAGVMSALGPDDAVVATYREHGHALLRGVPATSIMAEMYGRVEGCCRGRGGSMHLFETRLTDPTPAVLRGRARSPRRGVRRRPR